MTATAAIEPNLNVDLLTLSPAAAQKFKQLLAEQGEEDLKLRVEVTSGCGGPQIEFAFDKNIGFDDVCVSQHGVDLLLDAEAASHVQGIEIDYIEGVDGAEFLIRGLDDESGCGCGCGCNG